MTERVAVTERVDVAVLGGGPAGASAAAHLARAGFAVRLIDPLGIGGALINVDHLPDHPDHPDGIAGWDLAATLGDDALTAGATVTMGRAGAVASDGVGGWIVPVDSGEAVGARAVLVATGCRPRLLPGDDGSLEGRGVSYCAVCDGGLFAGKPVIVVGDGPVAFAEARSLAPLAASVTVVVSGDQPAADATWVRAAIAEGPVTVMTGLTVAAVVVGDDGMAAGVEAVPTAVPGGQAGDSAAAVTITAAGVFGALEPVPDSGPVAGVATVDPAGAIPVDATFALVGAPPGLFAAGDVRVGAAGRAAAAAHDGVAAASAITHYLRP